MSTTTKTTKTQAHVCGFCSTQHHDKCPGGVLNGNQTEVVICPCECDTPKVRCLNCNAREDVNPATWTCQDSEACTAKLDRRRAETHKALYGDRAPVELAKAQEKTEKAQRKAKPKFGKCLCCGETTGGGLFRPGHDSKYLTQAVAAVREGASLDDTMTAWARAGISEALQAKLVKRLGAA